MPTFNSQPSGGQKHEQSQFTPNKGKKNDSDGIYLIYKTIKMKGSIPGTWMRTCHTYQRKNRIEG